MISVRGRQSDACGNIQCFQWCSAPRIFLCRVTIFCQKSFTQSHEPWKLSDESIHCPTEQIEQDIQHWNKQPSVVAWLFVLRMGVIALIFLLPGEWFFAGLYRLDTTWLVPRYLPVIFSVDWWALSHGPTVLMGLVSIFMGLSLAFIQLCPWLLGFGFAALIAKGFYSMTVRFLKMPPWSDYEQIFRLRDKP